MKEYSVKIAVPPEVFRETMELKKEGHPVAQFLLDEDIDSLTYALVSSNTIDIDDFITVELMPNEAVSVSDKERVLIICEIQDGSDGQPVMIGEPRVFKWDVGASYGQSVN